MKQTRLLSEFRRLSEHTRLYPTMYNAVPSVILELEASRSQVARTLPLCYGAPKMFGVNLFYPLAMFCVWSQH